MITGNYRIMESVVIVQLPDLPDTTNSSTDNKRFIQILNYRKLPEKFKDRWLVGISDQPPQTNKYRKIGISDFSQYKQIKLHSAISPPLGESEGAYGKYRQYKLCPNRQSHKYQPLGYA